MSQGHGDRLTSLDTAFLSMETPTEHMHVAALFVFDKAPDRNFDFDQFQRLIRSRLHHVPRYRQVLRFAPLNLSNPVWVDDAHFDLAYHVRHAALPSPGTTPQLMEYCARLVSRPLDRNRPLWEIYAIEGLEDGKFALLGKSHHAMVDGQAGLDIATVLLDFEPDASLSIPPPEPWTAAAPPSGYDLAWSGVKDLMRTPQGLLEAARRLSAAPTRYVKQAVKVASGVGSVLTANLPKPAPRSPLNRDPGIHRRMSISRANLDDIKTVKNVYRVTVNDVVLAMVADAIGRFLRARDVSTDGLWLKAMVPVSVRSDEESTSLGNKVSSVFVSLPMFEMDPIERLEVCHEAMKDVKDHHHAVGADFLVGLTEFAPPTIHAAASRLSARARLYNFVVTNVPGPQVPIYGLGARLVAAYPFIPLAPNQSLAVGLISIDGWVCFGLTADYDAIPDVARLSPFIDDALAELLRSAEAADARTELLTGGRAGGNGEAKAETARAEPAATAES